MIYHHEQIRLKLFTHLAHRIQRFCSIDGGFQRPVNSLINRVDQVARRNAADDLDLWLLCP